LDLLSGVDRGSYPVIAHPPLA